MNIKDKIYIFLCLNFTALIIVGNLIYQKFVYLNFFNVHIFALSAGTIFYPLTFLLSDLIAEFYGKTGAKFCIRATIIISITISIIISFVANLEATPWSKVSNQAFNDIFAGFNIAFASSLIANYFAQLIDINIYLQLKKLTAAKYLWLRNIISTVISLSIDTTIVTCLMAIFGVLPYNQIGNLILNSCFYKSIFAILMTPLFYIFYLFIHKKLSNNDGTLAT